MPLKGQPRGKKSQAPPADSHKRQASNADEQPVKRPCWGTNQKAEAKPAKANKDEDKDEDEDEGEGEDKNMDEDEGEEDLAPWADVEEQAVGQLQKGKSRGQREDEGGIDIRKQPPCSGCL
jgi:hypothetical protein